MLSRVATGCREHGHTPQCPPPPGTPRETRAVSCCVSREHEAAGWPGRQLTPHSHLLTLVSSFPEFYQKDTCQAPRRVVATQ